MRTSSTNRVDGAGGDFRWPSYGPVAAKLGITAQLAIVMDGRPDALATLDLISVSEDSLASVEPTACLFAAQVSVLLTATSAVHALDEAIVTRQIIGQASGILMQRDGLGPSEAFDALVKVSQAKNIKLRDVARDLVEPHRRTPDR
ncbi:MAG: ANTAR domain-containing protein [Propionibacteriales bacterium]|nr:ANTAR domain-containing protein [Propionibacteriales bacterium]